MTEPYPYTSAKPPLHESSEDLRARIPGWGADLDPSDRPSVPKLQFDPKNTGAHWDFPERQPETRPRERSIEHRFLTPVFGTAQPAKGLPGAIRKLAYARYSEARAAHWLLLMAADRVDAVGSVLASFVSRHPDNLLTETGVLSELTAHGLTSRRGRNRADVLHHAIDPVIVVGPWVVGGLLARRALRRGVVVTRHLGHLTGRRTEAATRRALPSE